MYEFEVQHIHCGETMIIFGYSIYDACRRSNLDPNLWNVILMEYVD